MGERVPDYSEAVFLDQVKQIAKMNGWLVFHPVPAQVRPGAWRSDGKGFPDLVLAHRERGVIFAELKTMQGRLSDDQVSWCNALQPHIECYVWRPNQLNLIAERLSGRDRQQLW